MNATQQLDFYCERLGSGMWAEPLNVLSNLAFLLAAYLLFRRHGRDVSLWAGLIALVGLGSIAFHLFATVWAHWLDLLFIEVFIYSFIAVYLRRAFHFNWTKTILGLAAYLLFEWALTNAFEPGAWNGSYRYLPALILLVAMTLSAQWLLPSMLRPLVMSVIVFAVALLLRSVDMIFCGPWPWGTHFIWHMLNAAVLYYAALALRRRALN